MTETKHKDSTYSEEIEQNSNICSNCYRRLKFVVEPHEKTPDIAGDVVFHDEQTDSAWFDDRVPNGTNRPSVKRRHCKCGCVSPYTKFDRPIRDFHKYAIRIYERMEELGYELNESEFVESVHEKKDLPEYQHKDEQVFEDAIEENL